MPPRSGFFEIRMLGLSLPSASSPDRAAAPGVPRAARRWPARRIGVWALIAASVAAVSGATLYDGVRRVPMGPADGTAVNGAPARAATGPGFRVATWNID